MKKYLKIFLLFCFIAFIFSSVTFAETVIIKAPKLGMPMRSYQDIAKMISVYKKAEDSNEKEYWKVDKNITYIAFEVDLITGKEVIKKVKWNYVEQLDQTFKGIIQKEEYFLKMLCNVDKKDEQLSFKTCAYFDKKKLVVYFYNLQNISFEKSKLEMNFVNSKELEKFTGYPVVVKLNVYVETENTENKISDTMNLKQVKKHGFFKDVVVPMPIDKKNVTFYKDSTNNRILFEIPFKELSKQEVKSYEKAVDYFVLNMLPKKDYGNYVSPEVFTRKMLDKSGNMIFRPATTVQDRMNQRQKMLTALRANKQKTIKVNNYELSDVNKIYTEYGELKEGMQFETIEKLLPEANKTSSSKGKMEYKDIKIAKSVDNEKELASLIFTSFQGKINNIKIRYTKENKARKKNAKLVLSLSRPKVPNKDICKKGKQDEDGVYVLKSGDRFQGGKQKELPYGKGVYIFSSGDKYEGIFRKGLPNGKGKYFSSSGNILEGTFKDGNLQGNGTITYKNGMVQKTFFENGMPRQNQDEFVLPVGQKFRIF